MARFRVTADGLWIRSAPVKQDGNEIAVMPRGTVYERASRTPAGRPLRG